MWSCPICSLQFKNNNQVHSCNDKVLQDFLKGKTEHTLSLFAHFVKACQQLGPVTIHPTKSMIGIAAKTRIAYITRLGKDFVDIVFPFQERHDDNLCFHKIAQVPGSNQFNHHFRMMSEEDINEELLAYMILAFNIGNN